MREILIATRNKGKLHEIKMLLAGASLRLVSLPDLGIGLDFEETKETFEGNAVDKAVHYSRQTDLLTLADDSGLKVDALGGDPGVRSARFGGAGLSDEGRCRLLLKQMEKLGWEDRVAHFVCVLALAQKGAKVRTFRGMVDGVIAFEPRGTNGFGYDPIFYHPQSARTFGEMTREEKDTFSHRGIALREFHQYIEDSL